jgi:hypothetical protein
MAPLRKGNYYAKCVIYGYGMLMCKMGMKQVSVFNFHTVSHTHHTRRNGNYYGNCGACGVTTSHTMGTV